MSGSVQMITGPMFSGKSTELVRRLRRYHAVGQQAMIFKPVKDDRSGDTVKTHDGHSLEAMPIGRLADAFKLENGLKCVAIDELQFFDVEQVDIQLMLALTRMGVDVILAGLDLDQDGEPFYSVKELMPYMDNVLKLHSICLQCKRPATRSMWVSQEPYNEETRVGGNDKYEARCFDCFVPYRQRSLAFSL